MKIIFEEKKQEINIDDLEDSHIVCAIINNDPCLLTKDHKNKFKSFKILTENFSKGNSYTNNDMNLKSYMVSLNNNFKVKAEAFDEEDWKEALQWLIDNAE